MNANRNHLYCGHLSKIALTVSLVVLNWAGLPGITDAASEMRIDALAADAGGHLDLLSLNNRIVRLPNADHATNDLSVSRQIDASTTDLMNAAAMGRHFDEIELVFRTIERSNWAGDVLRSAVYIRLNQAHITRHAIAMEPGETEPVESVGFHYESLDLHYWVDPKRPERVWLTQSLVMEDAGIGSFVAAIMVDDPDPGDFHTLALLDDADGRFALNGNALEVADASRIDFESAGFHEVVVEATDTTGQIRVETLVVSVGDAYEGRFDAWRLDYFSDAELDDHEVSGYFGDRDGDGLSNLREYASGGDPVDRSDRDVSKITLGFVDLNGDIYATAAFRRRAASADPNMTVDVEFSANLVNWSSGEAAFEIVSTDPVGPETEVVVMRAKRPIADSPRGYCRLRITRR